MIDFTKDTHIHTAYSPDADKKATFQRYIDKAVDLGLKELTFTDHVDFDAVHPLFFNMIDYDTYIKDFNEVKKMSKIPIKLGVEIGYQEHMTTEINTFIDKYPFDHVILSIHYIEKKDLYTKEYFKRKTKKEAYSIYFDTCIKAVLEIPNFTVFGHLDYITRYSEMGDYLYTDYQEQIDTLLNLIIKNDSGIEINTSGFVVGENPYPKYQVIKRFKELGGTFITMGSDAHNIEELGRSFTKVQKQLKKAIQI